MRPHQSHLFGFAPASMSSFAVSKWKLSIARNSGVTPFGSGRSTFAPAVDERAHAFDAALARREQQRRQAAERPVHAPRLARDLPRPLVDDGARVDVGAVLERAAATIAGWFCAAAHISAVCSRQSSRALTSAPCSISAAAAAVLPLRATTISAVCPSAPGASTAAPPVEQRVDDLGVADGRGLRERRRAELVRGRDVRARPRSSRSTSATLPL